MNRVYWIEVNNVYLFLALFWVFVGVVIQAFWTTLQPLMMIPVDRSVMGLICFVMFSYSFLRWRLGQAMQRARSEAAKTQPKPHRSEQPIDPTFDFSEPIPNDDKNDKKT